MPRFSIKAVQVMMVLLLAPAGLLAACSQQQGSTGQNVRQSQVREESETEQDSPMDVPDWYRQISAGEPVTPVPEATEPQESVQESDRLPAVEESEAVETGSQSQTRRVTVRGYW